MEKALVYQKSESGVRPPRWQVGSLAPSLRDTRPYSFACSSLPEIFYTGNFGKIIVLGPDGSPVCPGGRQDLSCSLLFVFSIPILLVAVMVKITSKGPALYGSDRVGINNSIFKMYKFRTMKIVGSDHVSG
jgi:hypothetical protein